MKYLLTNMVFVLLVMAMIILLPMEIYPQTGVIVEIIEIEVDLEDYEEIHQKKIKEFEVIDIPCSDADDTKEGIYEEILIEDFDAVDNNDEDNEDNEIEEIVIEDNEIEEIVIEDGYISLDPDIEDIRNDIEREMKTEEELYNTVYNDVIQASEIIERLNNEEDIYYENVIIKGDLDFTLVVVNSFPTLINSDGYFTYEVYDNYIINKIYFENCRFDGNIITHRIVETDIDEIEYKVVFEEDVSFLNTIFNGKILFYETKFIKSANFFNSIYNDEVNVLDSMYLKTALLSGVYKDSVDFSGTLFEGKCFVVNSVFESNINFHSTIFVDIASFIGSKFFGEVDFSRSNFISDVYFLEVIFKNYVDFSYSTFYSSENLFNLTFFESGVNFSNINYYNK